MVGAGAPVETIADGVAEQAILARAADGIFDGHVEGDGDVLGQAAGIAERALVEVDQRAVGIAGEVDRIDPARVPDRDDRPGGDREVERRGRARVRVEPVDGIPRAGRHVRAVERLEGEDVVEERRAPAIQDIADEVVRSRIRRREVGHDRILDRVLDEFRIVRIGGSLAVIIARVRQTHGVQDFVKRDERGEVLPTLVGLPLRDPARC